MALSTFLGCKRAPDEPAPPAPQVTAKELAPPEAAPAPPEAAPAPPVVASEYTTPTRTSEELLADLKTICESAAQKQSPLLMEFSAPWCGDCRKLAEMKKEPVLLAQLEQSPHYVVNIGHFDQHEDLLEAFDIHSIANWQIVGTDNCSEPPGKWKRLEARTLEPRSGKKVSAAELAQWLKTAMAAPAAKAL